MRFSSRSSMSVVISLVTFLTVMSGFMIAASSGNILHARAAAGAHMSVNCATSPLCTEVDNPYAVFHGYVGHDEPSTLFYSNKPGSGNRMRYELTLPHDPSPTNPLAPGKSFNFQLHPAFWFGMAMCASMSYPELLSTCTPDSDSNIVDPAVSPNHPGTAFMEMQFYPPGWISWPPGNSCDATMWCAALNIDSLAENPVTGTTQNSTCVNNVIGSIEYVNFAFITTNGVPTGPPNPVDSNGFTFTPDPTRDLFMNSGDTIQVTMHDTAHGLRIDLNDLSSGQSGFMVASAANGFGQVQYDPTGTSCTNVPYDFHPMYSTSSEHTRVTWAAHSYNIAFSDETGHFQACNGTDTITPGGNCPASNTEYDGEASDANDTYCFPASSSLLVQVPGCFELNGNTGFDSLPYNHVWPDGNPNHPTSILFTSPLTGPRYHTNYKRMAFEVDLPRIEFGIPNPCIRTGPNAGTNCTLIPQTDDGVPANFYPFYSIGNPGGQCTWMLGEDPPGTTNDFGKNSQYGSLLQLSYTVKGGGFILITEDFRQILGKNPCKVKGGNND